MHDDLEVSTDMDNEQSGRASRAITHTGRSGRGLMDALGAITAIDPDYLQFGSAGWFWERWRNSYALQVEPAGYMTRDDVVLAAAEARHVQHTRDLFFSALRNVLAREVGERQTDSPDHPARKPRA